MDEINFKVLVLDDDEDITEIIQSMLTRAGFPCEVYNDPHKALESISQNKFSAVLSDFSMPEMNGIELLRQVRARGIEVPFVFLTANSDSEFLRSALRLGALDYISKPCQNAEVIEVMSRAMEIGKRNQSLISGSSSEQRQKDLKFIQKLRVGKK